MYISSRQTVQSTMSEMCGMQEPALTIMQIILSVPPLFKAIVPWTVDVSLQINCTKTETLYSV